MAQVRYAIPKRMKSRVHPTRSLPAAKPRSGHGGSSHESLKRIVADFGPWPYLYAQKHKPEGVSAMAVVERALWPETENVPAGEGEVTWGVAEGTLFRTFREHAAEEEWVARWAGEGSARALDALLGVDAFDVGLNWSSQRLIFMELRGQTPPPAGIIAHGVARALRFHLSTVSEEDYAGARDLAEQRWKKPERAWQRPALAYLFPDRAEWGKAALEELLVAGADGHDDDVRRYWLRWMLAVPQTLADAKRVFEALDDDVAYSLKRGDTPLVTWIALAEARGDDPAPLESFLMERLTPRLAKASAYARARDLAEGAALLASSALVRLFVDHLGHRGLKKIAPDYLDAHAALAVPELKRAAEEKRKPKYKYEKLAAELALVLMNKHPELSDAADGTAEAVRAEHEVASSSELPAVLAAPPWLSKKKRVPLKLLDARVAELPHEERLALGDEDREAWLELGKRLRWQAEPERTLEDAVRSISMEHHNYTPQPSLPRYLLARHGLPLVPALVEWAERHGWLSGFDPLTVIDSPRAMPTLARAFEMDDGFPKWEAELTLFRFPRAAAVALIPLALSAGEQQKSAEATLAMLITHGAADAVRSVAREYGAEVEKALAPLIELEPEQGAPARAPSLPKFFVAEGLPPPVLANSGKALPADAVRVLGQMLRFSEAVVPYPGIASVRDACTSTSLDEFAWQLFKQWEHAKATPAQVFAARAIGYLGSETLLGKLADTIEKWPSKQAKVALWAIEAFLVSPLPTGVMYLTRFATQSKVPNLRQRAELLLHVLSRRGAGVRPTQGLEAIPSFGFEAGRLTLSEQFSVTLAGRLDLVEHGKPSGAGMRQRVADLKHVLEQAGRHIVFHLELSMAGGKRLTAHDARRVLVDHPLIGRFTSGLVLGCYSSQGELQATFCVEGSGYVDLNERPVEPATDAFVGIVHPVELDESTLGRWRDRMTALGREQPFEQLARDVTRERPASWPDVRGIVVPYRSLERLIEQRGWALYRTHCSAPLHDWSYLQKAFDGGRHRLSIGFNFGKHVGDSIIGEVIGQHESFDKGIRHSMLPMPEDVSLVALSELERDLGVLRAGARG